MKLAVAAPLVWAVFTAVPCLADGPASPDAGVHWAAGSSTAMAITGDITLSPSQVQFQNGAALRIQYVADVPGFTPSGDPTTALPAQLFRLTDGANPSLLQGNTLCGPQPPTYLISQTRTLAGQPWLDLMLLLGDAPPDPASYATRLCATFGYVPADGG